LNEVMAVAVAVVVMAVGSQRTWVQRAGGKEHRHENSACPDPSF